MIEVPREALQYQAELTREARFAFGMDSPIALLAGQITQESEWKPDVCSKYACGLAQFTPQTARWISGVDNSLGPAEPLSPKWALRALVTYDELLHRGASPAKTDCDRWSFALSDYNGGSGWRIKRQKMSPQPEDFAITSAFNPGISKANQQQNAEYPFRIVYKWQPVFVNWSGPLVCLGK
jgi:soluble lytic murein transglycosylase-like protein